MRIALRGCLVAGTALAVAAGCGGGGSGGDGGGASETTVVAGDTQELFGGPVSLWARLAADGSLEAVGMTMPFAAIANAPVAPAGTAAAAGCGHQRASLASASASADGGGGAPHGSGDGPAGAVAVLKFPDVVREQTVFDHLELHWNPSGHEPENIYGRPHYDFHFYTVPVSDVLAVDCANPVQPSPDRMPPGYALPPGCVPEMGQHAIDPRSPEYAAVDAKFSATFLIGFWDGGLTFLEPMVTKEFLMGTPDFDFDIPVPAAFGRSTAYPTHFTASFDASAEAYEMEFTDFVAVQ
ncbi:MAG TPA: hypothetical protein VFD92_20255 [Candidatus Binatia bacterium]|nr:hypothetical protein [Candidatus Binatia bacterium]